MLSTVDPPRSVILLSPIGQVDWLPQKLLEQELTRVFGFVTQTRSILQDIEMAFDLQRRQYHSTRILEKLAQNAPPDAVRVLAVTSVDLFIPILTYVYGEAQLGGRAGIISTCRLAEGLSPVGQMQAYHHRMVKEALHELGHTFNLRHCPEETCLMHYCRSIGDVDRKTDQLCRYCQVLLHDEVQHLKLSMP